MDVSVQSTGSFNTIVGNQIHTFLDLVQKRHIPILDILSSLCHMRQNMIILDVWQSVG